MASSERRGPLVLISSIIGFMIGMSVGRGSSDFAIDRLNKTILDLHQTPPGDPLVQSSMLSLSIVSGCAILGAVLIPAVTVFVTTRLTRRRHD